MLISVRAPVPVQLEQMFGSPRLECKSCTATSKTMRRIVCRGEAELANKLFKSSGEECRGNGRKTGGGMEAEERIVGLGGHQAKVLVDGGDLAERGVWNAGQRDNMNSFIMLASLGPFYPEETARRCELDIAPSKVAFAVKG